MLIPICFLYREDGELQTPFLEKKKEKEDVKPIDMGLLAHHIFRMMYIRLYLLAVSDVLEKIYTRHNTRDERTLLRFTCRAVQRLGLYY